VGEKGASIGLDHFGASAPAKVLYEKFGFTPEAIAAKAKEVLEASK
jgi:transketolase